MSQLPPLAALGRRIMVMGLTNAGKSTLTAALARRLGIAAIHLDQLQHLPHTNWQQRPEADFAELHDAAILADAWVMDGSYSRLVPQRLARATGIIVVTDSLLTRYWRYFRRSLFERNGPGRLEGGQDGVNWKMIRWLWKTRNSVGKYQDLAKASGLPHVLVSNRAELDALYAAWGLNRPGA